MRDFGAGRAGDALTALDAHDELRFAANTKTAVQDIVAHRRSRVDAGVEPLILARSNAQIRQIALAVRDDCRGVGELGEDMVSFTGRANDRVFAMSLGLGDRIRFNVKVNDLDVVNGTTALVTAIIPAPEPMQTVVVALIGNRGIRFKLADLANEKGQVGLTWSYASTIFSAQGLTVDETLVLADAGFDRSAAYVACSRARDRTTLFVDRSTLESLEQFEPGPPDTLRQRLASVLANRWARNPKKTSTLDYISPENWQHLTPAAERQTLTDMSEGRTMSKTLFLPDQPTGKDADIAPKQHVTVFGGKVYLTRRQVPLHYPISEHTLAMLASKGRGPRFFKPTDKALYLPTDIEAWIEAAASSPSPGRLP